MAGTAERENLHDAVTQTGDQDINNNSPDYTSSSYWCEAMSRMQSLTSGSPNLGLLQVTPGILVSYRQAISVGCSVNEF